MAKKWLVVGVAVGLLVALGTGALGAAKAEFRCAWITGWSSGFLTKAEVDETIRLAKRANMNALLVEVRKVGDADYKSNFEPRATNIPDADFDPLAYLCEQAHKEGMEVHAWLVTFRVYQGDLAAAPKNHVVALHPDWLAKDFAGSTKGPEGMYLDPGIPEVQDWTVNVFLDVVRNYDIDGIHFDYVRYAGNKWGYSDKAVERFNKEMARTGLPDPNDPAWCEWRRERVSEVVRRVFKGTRLIKPKCVVSGSLIPWGRCPDDFTKTSAYSAVFQDWASWAKEGIMDCLMPMNYGHGDTFASWLDGMNRWKADRHAYTGMSWSMGGGGGRRRRPAGTPGAPGAPGTAPNAGTPGAAANAGTPATPPANPAADAAARAAAVTASTERAIAEIKLAREKNVEGVCGFAFNTGQWREAFAEALRKEVFQEPAPIPERTWMPKEAPKPVDTKAPGAEVFK